MKKCSLNHFTESLTPWLDENYLNKVTLKKGNKVTFSFNDGVNDTFEISDCNTSQLNKVCRDLAARGIKVDGLEQ